MRVTLGPDYFELLHRFQNLRIDRELIDNPVIDDRYRPAFPNDLEGFYSGLVENSMVNFCLGLLIALSESDVPFIPYGVYLLSSHLEWCPALDIRMRGIDEK